MYRGNQQALNSIISQIGQHGLTKSDVLNMLAKVREQYQEVDVDYLCALLFPESSYPARLPSKYSTPSAIFTDRFTSYLNTGANGCGWVSFCPKDTTFYCLFKNSLHQPYVGNPGNKLLPLTVCPESICNQLIPNNYAQARLIGASIRIQYIGVAQDESGFLVGSHLFESTVGKISDEIIQEGYHVTRGRPFEGMRLVWHPKDEKDFEYFDCNYKIVPVYDNTQTQDAGQGTGLPPLYPGTADIQALETDLGPAIQYVEQHLSYTEAISTTNSLLMIPGTVKMDSNVLVGEKPVEVRSIIDKLIHWAGGVLKGVTLGDITHGINKIIGWLNSATDQTTAGTLKTPLQSLLTEFNTKISNYYGANHPMLNADANGQLSSDFDITTIDLDPIKDFMTPVSQRLAVQTNFNDEWHEANSYAAIKNSTTNQFNGGYVSLVSPAQVYGMGSDKLQSTTPTQLVISWRGMPTDKVWLRVDVERHFEGIPRQHIREIVGVAKPTPSERTMEVARKIGDMTKVFSHTMEQYQQLESYVKPNLANLNPENALRIQQTMGQSLESIVKELSGVEIGGASRDPYVRQGLTYMQPQRQMNDGML